MKGQNCEVFFLNTSVLAHAVQHHEAFSRSWEAKRSLCQFCSTAFAGTVQICQCLCGLIKEKKSCTVQLLPAVGHWKAQFTKDSSMHEELLASTSMRHLCVLQKWCCSMHSLSAVDGAVMCGSQHAFCLSHKEIRRCTICRCWLQVYGNAGVARDIKERNTHLAYCTNDERCGTRHGLLVLSITRPCSVSSAAATCVMSLLSTPRRCFMSVHNLRLPQAVCRQPVHMASK